jgi:hypothetical protein
MKTRVEFPLLTAALLCAVAFAATSGLAQQVPASAPAQTPATPVPAAQLTAEDQPEFDPSDLTNPLAEFSVGTTRPKKPTGPVDPDLPQPFDAASITTAVKASPFSRTVNLSDSLVLTGIASIDGKPMATLLDKEKGRSYIVSEEPNQQGWRLEEIKPTASIKFSQVKVNIGGEIVTIRPDSEAQSEALKKHKAAPGGGDSGPPPPSGGDKGFQRDRRGPPPEVIERYNRLSDDAKNRLRKTFEDSRERLMNMSPDDRRTFMESNFKKVAEEDEKSKK